MDPEQTTRITHDPLFTALVRHRRLLSGTLALTVLTLFFGLVLSMGLVPGWLGHPLTDGPVNRGLASVFLIIALTFAVIGLYAHVSNTRYDPRLAEVLRNSRR